MLRVHLCAMSACVFVCNFDSALSLYSSNAKKVVGATVVYVSTSLEFTLNFIDAKKYH